MPFVTHSRKSLNINNKIIIMDCSHFVKKPGRIGKGFAFYRGIGALGYKMRYQQNPKNS